MESTDSLEPILSIILPAMLGWETVGAALDAWDAQTCRSQLEVLVMAPDAEEATALPPGTTAVSTGSLLIHEARALGVRRARGRHVLIAEDHCIPDPSSAALILARIADGWDVVGPALRPGNAETACAQASFLLGYGQWMEPIPGGPTEVVPGHNVVVPRERLLALGESLEDELLMSAFLVRRLRQEGLKFYLEEGWRMRHFDLATFRPTIPIFLTVGLGFGAVRTREWSLPLRLLYPLAGLFVAFRHWGRAALQYRRAGRRAGLGLASLVAALPLAVCWATGEALGAVSGIERVAPHVWICEVKPVSRADAERTDGANDSDSGSAIRP